MEKICALQMDPLETINIHGDSSFALGLEAIQRGYRLFHYLPHRVSFRGNTNPAEVVAAGSFVQLTRAGGGKHFSVIEMVEQFPLGKADVIWLRQDPPFDMSYITSCHLLELLVEQQRAKGERTSLVVNNPKSVRSSPEKLAVLNFPDLMPETLVSNNLAELKSFHQQYGEIVLKPLFGNGGLGVVYLGKNDPNLTAYYELHQLRERTPIMAQRFIQNVKKGDKRILLVDGLALGVINRVPEAGQVRANMHVGGRAEPSELTIRDQAIVARLKNWLRDEGLLFVGIDVIDGFLTEINVTSPTGIQESDRLMRTNLAKDIWNVIEKKLPKNNIAI